MRILIIDDDITVAKALARTLRRDSVTIEIHAGAALDRIERGETFDVVICDVMMPGYDGRVVVSQILAMVAERGAEPPMCMLMSGYDDLGELPPGVTVLVKPFSAADLRASLVDTVPQPEAG